MGGPARSTLSICREVPQNRERSYSLPLRWDCRPYSNHGRDVGRLNHESDPTARQCEGNRIFAYGKALGDLPNYAETLTGFPTRLRLGGELRERNGRGGSPAGREVSQSTTFWESRTQNK